MRSLSGWEAILLVGKTQEKSPVFRTKKHTNPQMGQTYPWIVRSTVPGQPVPLLRHGRDFRAVLREVLHLR
jgi:hypothetical protein